MESKLNIRRRPKSIMVIDDVELVLFQVSVMAKRLGIQTVLMRDPREFQADWVKQDVDLILTDIFMPGKSGLEIIVEVQEEVSHLPVMAMSSGYEAHKHRDQALRAAVKLGARNILQKPFTFWQFKDAMRDMELVA